MAPHVNKQKGFTLLELILYMSIFTVLVGGVLYASFYLQKILEYNSVEYSIKENLYTYFTLLEEQSNISSSIEFSSSTIKISGPYSTCEHTLQNGKINLTYVHANGSSIRIDLHPYIVFESFSFIPLEKRDTFSTQHTLKIFVERKSLRNKTSSYSETLIVPTVDFSSIP